MPRKIIHKKTIKEILTVDMGLNPIEDKEKYSLWKGVISSVCKIIIENEEEQYINLHPRKSGEGYDRIMSMFHCLEKLKLKK